MAEERIGGEEEVDKQKGFIKTCQIEGEAQQETRREVKRNDKRKQWDRLEYRRQRWIKPGREEGVFAAGALYEISPTAHCLH